MKRRVTAMLFKAFAVLLLAGSMSSAASAADAEMTVPLHRSEIISLPSDLSQVLVANPNIADVYVHGSNKISVVGKNVGTTSLNVLDKDNRVLRSLTVRVTYDLPAIRQSLYQFFPYEDISVQTVNNNLALTGMVSSPAVAAKAVMIANEFLYPSGQENPVTRPRGEFAGMNEGATQNGTDTGVINMLKVTSGQQVMLRVRVGELQRNAMKQIGFNWSALNSGNISIASGIGVGATPVTNGLVSTGPGALTSVANTFGSLGGNVNIGGANITAMIDALEQNDLLKILAEPNLVAISGEEAEFLAGGEFPIPVPQQDGAVTIEYREYGVSVRFLPNVLSNSRIRILVKPEISELTDIGAITLAGTTLPGLTTRRAKTTVELAPGESFMIAGLIQDNMRSTIEQVPGLGEVPVLSALFRSTRFQRNESELVIAVTPYLVDPVTGEDVRLPSDNYRPPSFMEQFFYGALGSLSKDSLKVSQTPSLEGPIGFMVD